jgi:hypothetical protein
MPYCALEIWVKAFTKPFVPQKDKERRKPPREWKGKSKLDDETRWELMRKKLCFNYRDPWVPGHRCLGKGQIHYIEVASDSDEEEISSTSNSGSKEEHTQEEGQPPKKPQSQTKPQSGGTTKP